MLNEIIEHLVKAKNVVERDYDLKTSGLVYKNEAIGCIEKLINACNSELSDQKTTRRKVVYNDKLRKGTTRVHRQLQRMLDNGFFSPRVELRRSQVIDEKM